MGIPALAYDWWSYGDFGLRIPGADIVREADVSWNIMVLTVDGENG